MAPASLIFSDGGTHTVDTFISDYIEVRNDSSGNPTTVTFNAGAIITGVDPYDDTMFVRGSSSAIVNGGSFSNDVSGYNRASISIFGGLFNDDIYTANMAQVKIFGGIIAEDLVAEDSSSTIFRSDSSSSRTSV